MVPTYTTLKRSLSPTIIVVPHYSDEAIVSLHFENGVRINALRVNHFTKRCEREEQLKFRGVVDIHLVTTGSPNVYYLVKWSNDKQCFQCTCYAYRRDGCCEHCETMREHREAMIA
jgi:hypothetical protein